MTQRELTGREKAAIRRLVTSLCANYAPEYGCLPLDARCYMLGKCWTGHFCRYFEKAVLPAEPALAAALADTGPAPQTVLCPVCGRGLVADGRRRYCSPACAHNAHRRQQRAYMRKKRG